VPVRRRAEAEMPKALVEAVNIGERLRQRPLSKFHETPHKRPGNGARNTVQRGEH
jgi:hypothetical protein